MPPHGDAPLADRRLHPLSWLFVLLQQLKQFIVPLLVLLFVGRGSGRGGGSNELWPLIGVGVLALASLWQYLTYRYRITADSVIVQQGLLQRSHRQIPFSRIHNVTVHQSLLHRLFKVAEVRLESAGGQKPEAEMRVLRMADAIALEALVRRGGSAATHAGDAGDSGARDAGTALLALAPGEVLRLGLVSNRGMLVVGAVAAAASQISPRLLPNLFERWGKTLFGDAGRYEFGTLDYALAVATLAIGFVLLMRMLSMGIALLQYFGFRLDRHGHRLTVERGLLTRLRTSASLRRLQAFTLREGVVHRLLRRRSLDVDTAVIAAQNDQRALRELAPIATAEACDALVRAVLPHVSWPPPAWQALHTHAWWRLALPGAALALALCAGLGWRFGAWGALGLLWLPWAVFVARQHARRAGYAIDDALIAVRAGWWSRHWRFAELDKLQALQLQRSPLDRALGMATLSLDTAGAGAFSQALRIRYLAHADAQALYARCGRRMARRPLRW
ncbi:MAG: PH domain-containing protein [Luteimonas sp.]